MTALSNDDELVDPCDLEDDELFDEIFVKPGLNLLTNIVMLARGYQHGSPRGVLAKALIISALSEPETTFYTGMATAPLNLQIGFVGASGRGKGRAMSAPILPVNGASWRKDTPASGEALISKFFDTDFNEETKKYEAVRHNDGVWAEWAEIDGYAAKAGKSNGTQTGGGSSATLDSHIRSLVTGESVGDSSISRDKQGIGSRLESLSYRFIVTLGVQPTRAHPLLKDGGGGTLQRTLWIGVTDPQCPRTATEIRAVRAKLAKRLGMASTPDDAPILRVVGPAKVEVLRHIQDRIIEDAATVSSGSDDIADDDTHMNNLAIRLAAIYGAWVAYEKRASVPSVPQFGGGTMPQSITSVIDDEAWRWAQCFVEMSRRDRDSISHCAKKSVSKDMHERGEQDAERLLARDRRIESENDAEARKCLGRITELLARGGGKMDGRSLRNNYLSKKQRSHYNDAIEVGVSEGVVSIETDASRNTIICLEEKGGYNL